MLIFITMVEFTISNDSITSYPDMIKVHLCMDVLLLYLFLPCFVYFPIGDCQPPTLVKINYCDSLEQCYKPIFNLLPHELSCSALSLG